MDELVSKWWAVGFLIMTIVAAWLLYRLEAVDGKYKGAEGNYRQVQSHLSIVNSVNAQFQQTCIQNAQKVADAAPTLPNTGPNETAAISACQAEYPIH